MSKNCRSITIIRQLYFTSPSNQVQHAFCETSAFRETKTEVTKDFKKIFNKLLAYLLNFSFNFY